MDIICIGLNHTTAPLSMRERVAFSEAEIESSVPTLLQRLKPQEKGAICESLILSTCNRMEIYAVAENGNVILPNLLSLLAEIKGVAKSELEAYTYSFLGDEATAHAFRVTAGIDSMVLGETQIAGQVKKAVLTSRKAGGLGLFLNRLFQEAFSTAKLVRSHTAIGRNTVSLSAAAVRLAQRLFGDLSKRNVLYIGAGEMIELCAAHFSAQHPAHITVANRSLDRGQSLASKFGGKAVRLQDIPNQISQFDIIVSCTASSLPIIGLGMVVRAVKERHHEPICIIDLAVPRDVEPEVSDLSDVFVYTIDDLGRVVQAGKESRSGALQKAEELVKERIQQFAQWKETRESVPAIITLRERAKALADEELQRAKKALAAGTAPEKVVERLTHALTNKFAHAPTVYLREAAKRTASERKKDVADFYRPRQS